MDEIVRPETVKKVRSPQEKLPFVRSGQVTVTLMREHDFIRVVRSGSSGQAFSTSSMQGLVRPGWGGKIFSFVQLSTSSIDPIEGAAEWRDVYASKQMASQARSL
ncbi:hypothetical protein GPL17_26955 [Bradyrhizobium yuanmingense]|uniref:hypothetical protein n=1 Tax=Bradyrhizobium yuanmingense TaxID=108015 RepID=UPI0012F8643B|nr:hypothetical protein [Bradyrhizobium yuanmingense]MDF0522986.1 hypothetical protein [Bradyrhizobium yuanmingense]MVT54109.1 hypothetical protein [Bradyrhizobium yuanmingense]